MDPTSGQAPQEEGVHRAEGELSRLRARPRPVHVVEEPGDLGGGEVGVEDEAGPLGDEGFVPPTAQRGALVRGAPVLPDDRAVDRTARRPFPHEHRLALVRDSDGRDCLRTAVRLRKHRPDGGHSGGPKILGVVLHLAGAREMLVERLLGDGDDPRPVVEEQRPGRRRPLVDREYVLRHFGSSLLSLPAPMVSARTRGIAVLSRILANARGSAPPAGPRREGSYGSKERKEEAKPRSSRGLCPKCSR